MVVERDHLCASVEGDGPEEKRSVMLLGWSCCAPHNLAAQKGTTSSRNKYETGLEEHRKTFLGDVQEAECLLRSDCEAGDRQGCQECEGERAERGENLQELCSELVKEFRERVAQDSALIEAWVSPCCGGGVISSIAFHKRVSFGTRSEPQKTMRNPVLLSHYAA